MAGNGDDLPVNDVNLTFDDAADSSLPDAGQIVSGTYKPSIGSFCTPVSFPFPAPAGPYGSPSLSVFNGTNPNGPWSLYVMDDFPLSGGIGSISGGWSLDITVEAPDAEQMIADLRELVASLGIHHGITNALDAKLRAALAALEADDTDSACASMQSFLNLVEAQTGKKLNPGQAQHLTDAANHISEQIGCTAE